MKRHSIVVTAWSMVSVSFLPSVVSQASADVFNCEHHLSAPVPVLICTDQSSSPSGQSAWVTLRKMPAWGTHAGLTIIDLCLRDDGTSQGGLEPTLVVNDYLKTPLAGSCKRRYCTDKKKAFSFLLNSFPFPVGWTAIKFKLGAETQSFSISCDEFRDSAELQQGEQR